MSDVMKGMGFGLLLAIGLNYVGMIPVVGGMLAGYSFYIMIALILLFLWMGFRN